MVFGPGGEEGQFADMSEPAGRRRRLLFHLQELKYVNKRSSAATTESAASNRDAGRKIENTRHELISLVSPDGLGVPVVLQDSSRDLPGITGNF